MAAAKKTTTKKSAPFESITGAMPGLNPEAFKESFEKMNKSFEQVAGFQKDSVDAVISASTVMASSVEKLSSEQVEFTKSSIEEGVNAAKAMASCKSPQEALDLNAEFFRTSFERNMAQFNKMSEMLVDSGKQAVEPITDTYNQFVETVQSYRP